MTEGTSKIIDIKVVAKDTKKIIFSRPKGFVFKTGQFLMIKFDKKLMRAYSIASPPEEENIELIIRIIPGGKGTTIIDKASIGDKFTVAGGMGHFTLSENKNAELYFCVTGTGIAPIKSMIKSENKSENPRKMTLLYGGRDQGDLAYLDEISSWNPDLSVKIGFSTQEDIKKIIIPNLDAEISHSRITKFINAENFSDLAEFYICGCQGMVEGTKELLIKKGINKDKIFFERFN